VKAAAEEWGVEADSVERRFVSALLGTDPVAGRPLRGGAGERRPSFGRTVKRPNANLLRQERLGALRRFH
jgi:hypothetical protein